MRATRLRRFAPGWHRETAIESAAVPPELMPPELQKRMRTVFDQVRAEHIEVRIPGERLAEADDPWIRANSAAFLIVEAERRTVAARLCGTYWRRRDRYRDLALVTRLIHLEYEHLAGRVSRRDDPPSPPDGTSALNGDVPADWARPWGSGPMLEMRTTLIRYGGQGKRLARRLPARALARATADAERCRDRVWTRFERAMCDWSLELQRELVWAPQPRKSPARPWASLAVRARESLEARGWTNLARVAWTSLAAKPWGSLRVKGAAVAAVAVAGAGIGIAVTREPSASSSAPSRAALASVPVLPLAALSEKRPRASHPAPDGDAGQPTRDRSTAPEPTATDSVAPASAAPQVEAQTAPAAPPAVPSAPEPAPAAAPAPSPSPAPSPQPAPQPSPGPVHSLPAPVHSLPSPGGSSGG
jgi:hypothetical protein